ncbi:MAG: hypothetical protein R2729_21750 [Bryobacteraceae bacterium]
MRRFLIATLAALPALAADCPLKRALLEVKAAAAASEVRFTVEPLFAACGLAAKPPVRVTMVNARTGRRTNHKVEAGADGVYAVSVPASGEDTVLVLFKSASKRARLTKVPYLLVGQARHSEESGQISGN